MTRIFDNIMTIEDLRSCSEKDLPVIAKELREDLIKIISQTGGHLGASLGVVELTIALHYVFDTPHDKIIWDVGHQSYPHKMLTSRKHLLHTIRQKNGLSGFPKRSESPYDHFGTAHSSTSISAGLGMAVARELSGDDYAVISVIGDGAISAGMAFEALNNAGGLKSNMIVILNDNDMSIAPPVGAMSHYLSRIISSNPYVSLRHFSLNLLGKMPSFIEKGAKRAEEYMRGMITGGTLFEELGFYYIGPVDGHKFEHLLPLLRNVKKASLKGPILLHIHTEKGKGYAPAENSSDRYHGVSSFDPTTGKPKQSSSNKASFTQIFGETLSDFAQKDKKIIGITAAMPSGTGMNIVQKTIPDRVFDVAIAEQHAVTFGAGMACEGYKPFVAIYSTFLQRAYDQVIHDVVLQNLPVRFIIDRAGFVGADGATHTGAYDLAYLCCLPYIVVMAPSDENELRHMIATMVEYEQGPIAIRFPKNSIIGVESEPIAPIAIGKAKIIQKQSYIAVISCGTRLYDVKNACTKIQNEYDINITIIDARFAKPIDHELIFDIAQTHEAIITIEEGTSGGFGSMVSHFMAEHFLHKECVFSPLCMPDRIIDHGTIQEQYQEALLDEDAFYKHIINIHHHLSS